MDSNHDVIIYMYIYVHAARPLPSTPAPGNNLYLVAWKQYLRAHSFYT